MTLISSGPLRTWEGGTGYGLGTGIADEYGWNDPEGIYRLSQYYRGHAMGFVKKNAANNPTTNLSAAVPESGPMRMSVFYGLSKGWTYTNTTDRIVSGGAHYYPHNEYGDDWLGNSWPIEYINNAVIGATWADTLAVVLWGRDLGPFTFVNNNEIQGASGIPNSGAGQHAFYIQHTVGGANRPIIVNNYAIRGGGGAGGVGGTGGTGGTGYYVATGQEGPYYNPGNELWSARVTGTANRGFNCFWGGTNLCISAYGVLLGGTPPNATAWGYNGYTYYRHTHYGGPDPPTTGGAVSYYWIYRQWQYNQTVGGAGGGAGGSGGYGAGYGRANTGGNPGAGGGNNGGNSGVGGTGGTGGTGGWFGDYGQTGATGAGGGYGNYSGWGSAGAGGGGGGPPGYSIYAEPGCPFGYVNNNTLNGPVGGGTAPT